MDPILTSPLAPRAAHLQPSATLAMVARVRALQASGIEILDLTAGEPDFRPPSAAEEAGIRAIREGKGRYTPAAGIPELRAAAAQEASVITGLEYRPEELVVTTGGKLGINQALLALIGPGERVLVPTPCWTSYPEMIRISEGIPVPVPCGDDHLPRLEALETARADGGARMLLLNTPCNPTGAVYPSELLAEIGAWLVEHHILLLSDEIYASLTYEGVRHHSPIAAAPGLREQGVWIGGMSKAYAMTGWRMGFLAAPEPIAAAVAAVQSQLASSPNAISQYASLAALREGAGYRERMREAFARRARLVTEKLQAIPGLRCPTPRGAFYAFPDASAYLDGRRDPESGRPLRDADDLAEVLLEQDRVAVISGSAFGAEQALRLSFAAAEETLERALTRIAKRFARLAQPTKG